MGEWGIRRPGETNNVTFTSCGPACIDISDTGASIAAGWGWFMPFGCSNPEISDPGGNFPARCEFPGGQIDQILVNLLDGADQASMLLASGTNIVTFVNGGRGDDILVGGAASDNLRGNEGNNQLFGGMNCDALPIFSGSLLNNFLNHLFALSSSVFGAVPLVGAFVPLVQVWTWRHSCSGSVPPHFPSLISRRPSKRR